MGILRSLKSTYKKSEAAVVVQNLLEHQAQNGLFGFSPAKVATRLVEQVWSSKPDVFDGKFGQRPHEMIVAASALAYSINQPDDHEPSRDSFSLALANILSELETNGRLYPLNSLDHTLLEEILAIFTAYNKELSESPLIQELEDHESSQDSNSVSWEEWLHTFKLEAGKNNPQLELDEEGGSLIDLMEQEPLQRAHQDGIDPRSLARQFAEDFDIRSFGLG